MIGGLVMNRERFKRLDDGWKQMLYKYRLDSIHMTDFIRPNGRYCGMFPELKTALFRSVAQLIQRNRAYSIVMSIPLDDFNELVPATISRPLMRPYAMAFFMVVVQNSAFAEMGGYTHRISYLVDRSNFEDQIRDAHLWDSKVGGAR
jgi:hypothetical protein